MTVQAINPRGRNPIYRQYEGQLSPQPAFIELDCDLATLRAGWSPDNCVPESIHNNRILRWQVSPTMTCKSIRELFKRILADADTIVAGYDTFWDGNNTVGRYSQAAQAARDRIAYICEEEMSYC